jgi:hypothetical protein
VTTKGNLLISLVCFSFSTLFNYFVLAWGTLNDALWKFLGSRLTVPLFECLGRNLSLNKKLCELAPLSFAFERH